MLSPFLRKEWKALTAATVSTVFVSAADLAKPWPLAILIDTIFRGRQGAFDLNGADRNRLVAVAVLTVAIAAVDALSNYWAELSLERAGERINHNLRVAAYERLQRLSLGFHQRRQTGDLVTRVTGDVDAVGSLFSRSLGTIAQDGLLLVGMVVVTVSIDPLLALCSLPAVPILAVLSHRYRSRIKQASRRQRAEEGAIASMATEALSAMPVVKAFDAEGFERDRVQLRSRARMGHGIQIARLTARFDGLGDTLVAVATAFVIVVGALRVSAGAMSAGTLIVFASYARKVNSPLRSLVKELTRASSAMARAERIVEILATEEFLEEGPAPHAEGRAQGDIELEDVSFAFDPGRPVLSHVSLRIPAGSRVAIVGPSGAGKSTLAGLIARFRDPDEGCVRLDGRDVRDCSIAWLRGQVGVMLQDTILFSGTVAGNIAYSRDSTVEEIAGAARLAAASAFIEALPDGYETALGPRGLALSGGQRQRIGIARTLLRDPPILVLDEPTTALDAVTESDLISGLESLMRGRTTVLITHSATLARTADTIVVIDAGRIVQTGTPEEVLGGSFRAEPSGLLATPDAADAAIASDRPELIVLDALPPPAPPEESVPVAPAPRPSRRWAHAAPPPPTDRALPWMGDLLDAERMAPILSRSLGREATISDLSIGGVLYRPNRRVTVQYEATVDGLRRHAVAMTRAHRDLAATLNLPEYVSAARAVEGRSPARAPVSYVRRLDALVSWLPFDPSLPGLLEPTDRLVGRLRAAGVDLEDGTGAPVVLKYKPRVRAVMRVGGHILKAYGRAGDFELGVAGLKASASLDVEAPTFEASIPELRLTVQSDVEGRRPPSREIAAEAGSILRRMHASNVTGVRRIPPEQQLDAVVRGAVLIEAVARSCGRDAERVLARLAESVPAAEGLVLSHGDFHAGQLLLSQGALTVIDFDSLRMALPALDLARFAADELTGLDDDPEVETLLEPVLEGYGRRPDALRWHLAAETLRRAPRPFRQQLEDWPERLAGLVRAADRMLQGSS
jgi:ABC-type multidrug transport system fused ATPase/permease subunit